MLSSTERNRLRWRCRRGMLENDLVLSRYLDRRGDALSQDEAATLERLLALSDNELWDAIAGRGTLEDSSVQRLVEALRNA
jgi:antitoxin CptB